MFRLHQAVVALTLLAGCPIVLAAEGDQKPAAPKPTPVPLTSIQTGKKYVTQLKDGDPVDAVRRYWDIDAVLQGAFGDHLKNVPPADREEMKRLLLEFVERVHASAELAARLSQATFEGFRAKEHNGAPRTAAVNYYMVYKGDRILYTLLMRQAPDQRWQIIDSGALGQMIVAGIRKDYGKQSDQMTPVEFMQELVSRVRGP
jgi:hypothetical protein